MKNIYGIFILGICLIIFKSSYAQNGQFYNFKYGFEMGGGVANLNLVEDDFRKADYNLFLGPSVLTRFRIYQPNDFSINLKWIHANNSFFARAPFTQNTFSRGSLQYNYVAVEAAALMFNFFDFGIEPAIGIGYGLQSYVFNAFEFITQNNVTTESNELTKHLVGNIDAHLNLAVRYPLGKAIELSLNTTAIAMHPLESFDAYKPNKAGFGGADLSVIYGLSATYNWR